MASSVAYAAPFVFTCDLNPAEEQVTQYTLYLTIGTGTPTVIATTTVPPWPAVDLNPNVKGQLVTATAKNMWGLESNHSIPVILPPTATTPKSLRKNP